MEKIWAILIYNIKLQKVSNFSNKLIFFFFFKFVVLLYKKIYIKKQVVEKKIDDYLLKILEHFKLLFITLTKHVNK